ncbi:hypothetical protein [Chondromyces apiculatus]|uniref:Uncharacterized protein n=1 Tax=Chondromyces apiculatus DSM 436 TaxID=1192034 RepID=A0A017SU65_9BACT|nr:hypothetical protein [Chondromyces apiculatus]EYF00322.1 Hypothetical protein CAP_0934 [Chondromyces apiculatus DSM 436]
MDGVVDKAYVRIVAPPMLMPEHVPATHACRALRAVLRVAAAHPEAVRDRFCPGLATLVGGVPPEDAAREMAQAYGGFRGRPSPPAPR